jgi:predicted HicB family RNase H-like nuclease
MEDGKKGFLLRVPEDIFKDFKIAAVQNDISMNEILNNFIKKYLRNETKKA